MFYIQLAFHLANGDPAEFVRNKLAAKGVQSRDITIRTNVQTSVFTGCSFLLENNPDLNATTLTAVLGVSNVLGVSVRNLPPIC
jgi:hypothetical protein